MERIKIANEYGGNIFISIHTNTTEAKSVKGFETYLLGSAKTSDARKVAARENEVIFLENEKEKYFDIDIDFAIKSQEIIRKDSERLAHLVQNELEYLLPTKNRGVKDAEIYVLTGLTMANILIQVGFLSNRKECKLIGERSSYQKNIAEAIYNAIEKFISNYDSSSPQQIY